ncbi:WD repeat-containing protein 43 [Apophysomyces ossiformis]|uniref:WD repeat-containing protein 43 n=1 Tax=Apophysomyces ossiformis TaxID=679940 RepID=A0A8H7BPG0_9FUNG|nr:WD repeat-containing protein 43 [Apophysomyces ossiformis]
MGRNQFKPNPDTSITTTAATTAAAAGILLSGFDTSAAADHFALVSHGMDRHRLRIFNVRSGTVNNDYASENKEQFTCLTWGNIIDSADLGQTLDNKISKKRKTSALTKVVALGTHTGAIVLYSLVHGAIVRRLSGAHTMPVSDFVLHKAGNKGYSVSEDNYIVEWNIEEAKEIRKWKADVKHAHTLKLSHDGKKLAVAGHTISLFDLTTQQVVKKYMGHASVITELAFSQQDDVLVSIAEDDRYVNVWDANVENNNTNNLTALTLENNAAHIDFSATETSVLAVSQDGLVGVWQNASSQASSISSGSRRKMIRSMTRSADTTIKVVSLQSDQAAIPILSARFVVDNEGKSIMIARGSSVKPTFEVVQYVNAETGAMLDEITLTRQPTSNFLIDEASVAAANLKTTRKAYNERAVTVLANTDFVMKAPSVATDNLAEPSIEQRLQELGVEDGLTTNDIRKQRKNLSIPSAGSLQQVLMQALHSNDMQLLEACLQHNKVEVINSTVKRLPTTCVIPLLLQLVARFQEKPGRALDMLTWVRSILYIHSTYLMTVPDLVGKLSNFYQALDGRHAVFPKLLSLRGRLEMVQTQIQTRSTQTVKETERISALNVYNEQDSDDEAAAAAGLSEEEEDLMDLEDEFQNDEDEEMSSGEESDEDDEEEYEDEDL